MTRATFRTVFISCTIFTSLLGAQSQNPPQPQAPQFKAAIDLIHLDVSVLDKNRRPVRDLKAEDFIVTENGQKQDISAFTPVDVPGPESVSAPWIREVAPDVRGNANVQQRRLFIIAIDDATIENNPAALKGVKDIARKVVDRLGPADVASVVFTRDNRGSQDFTTDRARLLKAVDTFSGSVRGMGDTDDLWYLYSVGLLERAVDYLADLPEQRKAILYIGQGVPFNLETAATPVNAVPTVAAGAVSDSALHMRIKDQMTDVFDRATRSNVTIYPIDPCGLRQPAAQTPAGARAVKQTCVAGLEIDFLRDLAAGTGGRTVMNANDPDPGLNAVFAENASYYLLGYQSSDQAKDGQFRKLEVKVNRPDVEVRTRSGYDAPRDVASDRPRAAASPLSKALSSVLPTPDLPMQLTAAPFAVPGKPDAAVLIAVGLKQPIRQAEERVVENVDLQVAAFNSDGRSFGNTRQRADVTIRQGATGPAEYEVFGQIDLKPGRYQLRVAANVGSLEKAGSVYFDVDVPDFAGEPISMSGLLVTATPSPVCAPKELFKTVVPVLPTTRRAFSPTHSVSLFARVYQGGKAKIAAVTAHLTVRDSKDAVVLDKQLPLPANQFGATRAADLKIDVPTADLPAGAYVITVEVPLGSTTVRRDSRFQVFR